MCSSPICSEEHLVFYHIFSQFFTNIFEFLNLKTENGEKYRNSISRLLAETENFPVFRRFSAGKLNPGKGQGSSGPGSVSNLGCGTWTPAQHHKQVMSTVKNWLRLIPTQGHRVQSWNFYGSISCPLIFDDTGKGQRLFTRNVTSSVNSLIV